MISTSSGKEKPLDLFVKSIQGASEGINPTLSIEDALHITNLTSSKQDGWVMEDRMFGGPPQGFAGIPRAFYEEFLLNWKGLALGRAEKRVHTRQSSRIEEEAIKPMVAVFVVHIIRDEALCAKGKTRINNMNRRRPDLALEVLDDIKALNSVFPTPEELDEYKRRLVISGSIF